VAGQQHRHVTDDQARACADTGGVVGITGVGIFLGPNTPTVDAVLAQIDYVSASTAAVVENAPPVLQSPGTLVRDPDFGRA